MGVYRYVTHRTVEEGSPEWTSQRTIAQLTAERDRIDAAIKALEGIDGSAAPAPQPTTRRPVPDAYRAF